MKAVAVVANPYPDSLTHALAQSFLAGLAEKGAETEVIDLYADGFRPEFTLADRAHYSSLEQMPADVVRYQEKLEQADVIALVFPIYWYSMPAMMKGFMDRVICRQFGYMVDGTPGKLKGKTVRLICTTGADQNWSEDNRVRSSLEQQLLANTWRTFLSAPDTDLLMYFDAALGDDSSAAREKWTAQLNELKEIGAACAK